MRARNIYEVLLHAYPERTRLVRGADMTQLFLDQLRDADSSVERARIWVAAIVDICLTAPLDHLEWRRRMKVVEGPPIEPSSSLFSDLGVASIPLAVAFAVMVVRPPGYESMLDATASIAGLPLGIGVLIFSALLAGFGIVAARRELFRDPAAQVIAMCLLLLPALPSFVSFSLSDAAYASVVVMFVLALQMRWFALAMAVPFLVWVAGGPAIVGIVIGLGGAGPNS